MQYIMKHIHIDSINSYDDDLFSFGQYRPAANKRLWRSVFSLILSFVCLVLVFSTGPSWLFAFVSALFGALFVVYQKLPKIRCPNCNEHYVYHNVADGADEIIYGVCHGCKKKMNTEIGLTSG